MLTEWRSADHSIAFRKLANQEPSSKYQFENQTKIPEGGWNGYYPPTRVLHDFCVSRCIKKPEINLIDADGEAHCPVFTFE